MEEFLSLKKSMACLLFNGEGLDVHLVDLFCFTSFLPAVLLPSEFSQPLHLHLSAEKELPEVWQGHLDRRWSGTSVHAPLIFLSPSPHLKSSGVPSGVRALFLQFKHLHLLDH